MAIITTPNGWAIEFETEHHSENPTREQIAAHLAGEYEAVLRSLVRTIHIATDNKDFTNEPDYYTTLLLEAMLPTYKDAIVMFYEKIGLPSMAETGVSKE